MTCRCQLSSALHWATGVTQSQSSLQDRLMKRAVPRPVAGYAPAPQEVASGLWVLDRQLRHFGFARLPSRTTLIRLEEGSLVVVSPPPPVDAESAAAIAAIAPIRYVVAPSSFHYLFASAFAAQSPGASLLVAPLLKERVQSLASATELGPEPPSAWSGELAYSVLETVNGVSEVVLFHTRSKTLILTDLAFNMKRYPRRIDRLFWRSSGIPAQFGPGRTSRSLLLHDREAAARCLSRAAQWPITRIVVAHGDMVERDAAEQFRRAFADYLPEAMSSASTTPRRP